MEELCVCKIIGPRVWSFKGYFEDCPVHIWNVYQIYSDFWIVNFLYDKSKINIIFIFKITQGQPKSYFGRLPMVIRKNIYLPKTRVKHVLDSELLEEERRRTCLVRVNARKSFYIGFIIITEKKKSQSVLLKLVVLPFTNHSNEHTWLKVKS